MIGKWYEENGFLSREFHFASYPSALGFLVRIAFLAERADHHPRVEWDYRKVIVQLCTHDEGNQITELDRRLAAEIEQAYLEA